ncbi:MAG: NAD(P)-dependent oxidoreductase [Alphaproteobacteria bacterium]|nr:NAD(P)-dependent oxidoreductase [Alphaproteobacteria bacterium]
MAADKDIGDIAAERLSAEVYARNFQDVRPPLDHHQAAVEADRCYFCHDAPCVQACPTGIDVPLFIRQIATGNTQGAARTILGANIMGGMCARVCPTETLCEQVCVRNEGADEPVKIGRLQRFAVDALMATGTQPFSRARPTGKSIAVVGAGPAGLACAHALALVGHGVVLHDAGEKPGGLNEYGIAAYKTVDGFAQREIEFVLSVGGIDLKLGVRLGADITLDELRRDYDAVFLGLGMAGVKALGLDGEDLNGVHDAVDFIARLRQSQDLSRIPVGRRVVVIGGGMTAIDIAAQTRLLGAEEVTIVYRRGPDQMKASPHEREFAQTRGVSIRHWAQPSKLIGENGQIAAAVFERTANGRNGQLETTGEHFTLPADMLFKAVGQSLDSGPLSGNGEHPALANGRIAVDDKRKTDLPDVWAGGDCIDGGSDLTVSAVEDGKIAAAAIHHYVTENSDG